MHHPARRTGPVVSALVAVAATAFLAACVNDDATTAPRDVAASRGANAPPRERPSDDRAWRAAGRSADAGAEGGDDGARESEDGAPSVNVLVPFDGVRVRLDESGGPGSVELDAITVLDVGWLEQVACAVGTREHESLVVPTAEPSQVHAALLLAGFEPGRPGRWWWDEEAMTARLDAPEGDRVRVLVRDPAAGTVVPIADWITSTDGEPFPDAPWIFGGSVWLDEATGERFAAAGPPDGRDVVYVADRTGSIVGLVTFGDEVLGALEVVPDQEAVAAPEWMVRTDAVPVPGTPVVLVIEPWSAPAAEPRRDRGPASTP